MATKYRAILLFLILLLTVYTRFTGLTRGESDFVSPEDKAQGRAASFYTFHPDEETLARAAFELSDPFAPPLTAYGMLPLYIWRATLVLAGSFTDAELDSFDHAKPQIHQVLRLLSIAISLATLLLIWYLGRWLYNDWAAALGMILFAAAPATIQLAHFATVDGLHTLLCLIAFALSLRALDRSRALDYALAGLAIGLAGAVRFNGLLLGLVLVAGYLLQRGSLRGLATRPPWIAGGTALVALVAMQPYLAFDPELILRSESTDDLGFSLKVARGEILRIWTLVDVHTIPYLHYWTDLFPLACGWPLTLGILGAVGHAIWRRQSGLLLLFCGLYFAQVGGLHTKHVRYLLPMLPFLCLLVADRCVMLIGHRRRVGLAVCSLLILSTVVYGLAFTRIYAIEDSRIQAARFIAEHVPPGQIIGHERGGFSMNALIRGTRNPTRQLNITALFEARGNSTCRADINYLEGRLQDIEYITLVDINRARQFMAVPELTPAASAFYRRLLDGQLGYRVIRRFKHSPSLLGMDFPDDDAEPSFTGYDHPAVYVLARDSPAAVQAGLETMATALDRDPHCADAALRDIATAVLAEDLPVAEERLAPLADEYPHLAIVPFLQAEIYAKTDRPDAEQAARDRYKAMAEHRAAHILPWAAAMGLVDLGLDDLAAIALTEGTLKSPYFPKWAARDMARAYVLLANYAYDLGQEQLAFSAYSQSSQIDPSTAAFNRLAFLAFRRKDYPLAVAFWGRSVELEDNQAGIHSNLGQVYAQHLRDFRQALYHLDRAIQHDPRQREDLMPWVEMAQKNLAQ